RDDQHAGPERDGDDRQVHEEDRSPVEVLEQKAARHRTDRDGEPGHTGPDGDGAAALLPLEDVGDQRERARHDERPTDPHEGSGGDELTGRGRHRRQQRSEPEHGQPDLQRAPPAETVTEAASRQQQPREHERVRVDHPLQLARGGVEPALALGPREGWQRNVQDRVVDDDDEEAQTEDPEDPPPLLMHLVAHAPAFRDEGWRTPGTNAARYETHPSRTEWDEGLSRRGPAGLSTRRRGGRGRRRWR